MDIFERQKEESEEAYTAFLYFRELDRNKRNVKNAFAAFTKAHKIEAKNVPLEWHKWSENYRWKERAEARDIYLDEQINQFNIKSQLNELIRFRQKSQVFADLLSTTGHKLISKLSARLDILDVEEIGVDQIAGLLRAATAISQLGKDSMAEALALDEIIQSISDEEVPQQENKIEEWGMVVAGGTQYEYEDE